MSHSRSMICSVSAALLALGTAGAALADHGTSSRAPDAAQAAATDASHTALKSDERTARHARSHTRTARQQAGLAAAKAGTGASAVAAEKSEHMPVPKTGM